MSCSSRFIFENKICNVKLSLSVQNTGNKTIQLLTIIATKYNAAMQPVDDMQQRAIIGSNTVLEPGRFQLYDIIVGQKPVFFRLTFYPWISIAIMIRNHRYCSFSVLRLGLNCD